jgi:hypothetical protein
MASIAVFSSAVIVVAPSIGATAPLPAAAGALVAAGAAAGALVAAGAAAGALVAAAAGAFGAAGVEAFPPQAASTEVSANNVKVWNKIFLFIFLSPLKIGFLFTKVIYK